MTEIVVATRDGVLRAPSGEQFRMVRGKTLANAAHPAIQAYPDNWMPMKLDIDVDDPEVADPGHLEDDVAVELAELREDAKRSEADAARYQEQLQEIANVIDSRGLVPLNYDTETPGWLAGLVAHLLDTGTAAPREQVSPAADDVPPPPAPRKRSVPKATP